VIIDTDPAIAKDIDRRRCDNRHLLYPPGDKAALIKCERVGLIVDPNTTKQAPR